MLTAKIHEDLDNVVKEQTRVNDNVQDQFIHSNTNLSKQFQNFKTDFNNSIVNQKEQLGLGHKGLSSKVNLFTLNKVMEMILQYLMV